MNVLKILFNPIFLLAAGLHAGLLFIPVAGGSSEEIVPAPDPEGESITVTHIPLKQADKESASAKKASGSQAKKTSESKKAASGSSQAKKGTANNGNPQQRNNRPQGTSPRNVSEEVAQLSPASQNQPTPSPPAPGNGANSAPGRSATPPSELPQLLPPEERQTLLATLLADEETRRDVSANFLEWLAKVSRGYIYSEKGTTDAAVNMAKATWLAALGQNAGLVLIEAPDPLEKPLTINYPLVIDTDKGPLLVRRCLDPAPQEGLVGVVVEDGDIVRDSSTLLRSSGYPLLDDLALQVVQDYGDFPADEVLQAYTLKVNVDYDAKACVSLLKLGIEPLEVESDEPPTPPPGGRNPLEEAEGEPNPFGK